MSAVIPTPSPRDDDVAVEVHANGGAGDGSTAAAEESGATAGSTATTIQRKGSGSVSAAALQRLENRDSAKAMRTIFKSVAPDDDGSDDGTEYVVKLNNLHKTYLLGIEGVPAIRGVSAKVAKGEFVMIVGKSGSGKTSMLNIIGTIDKPTRGEVDLCGNRITQGTPDYTLADIRLRKLGFVFQTFNLLPSMTAQENVEMPMILAGASVATRKRRAAALLKSVGMGGRLGHTPSQLSGGEQQRVTIARALANKPEILLLDEPTGDLDTVNEDNVMRFLVDLNEMENVTMIMVTHEMSLRAYAHRVIHMLDGKVQRQTIAPKELRARAIADLRARTVGQTAITGVADGDDDATAGVPVAAAIEEGLERRTVSDYPSFALRAEA